jgi:hypothetical protein
MYLDSSDRPTSAKDAAKYLVTPINDFIEINPKNTFAKMKAYSGSFDSSTRNATITAVPIGVEADRKLETASLFNLALSSSSAKLSFPFDSISGNANVNPIGVVQLTDASGNPIRLSNDLNVNLMSNNTQVIQVPQSVTISAGSSYAQFPITSFGKQGFSVISADAKNVWGSRAEISVQPYSSKLKVSWDFIQEPISYNQDLNIKVFVDDDSNRPQQDALVQLTPIANATVTPNTAVTDQSGAATFILNPTAGPTTSITLHASKPGYIDDEKTLNLAVTGFQVISSGEFFGIPSWIMYVSVAGAVAGIAVVAFMFLKKPKELIEAEDEGEVEI